MLASKNINKIVICLIVLALIFTAVFIYKPSLLGITASAANAPYMEKLFDKDTVQTIEISMEEDSWQEMLDSAIEEQYFACDITINGETYYEVGIRPKGNSSLTMVANSDDTDRYSFKIKMDEYVDGQNYYGLSKFVVNNMQGDATYMKEYLSYDLYEYMGINTPAYAFANIKVNGEEWGFYLAVEAIEEEFAARTYGANYGELYKPESADMGGGGAPEERGGNGFASSGAMQRPEGGRSNVSGSSMQMPQDQKMPGGGPGETDGSGGGADLVYMDDEISSYSQIFDEAVFNSNSDGDKKRVIAALKTLNQSKETSELEEVINVDEVLRYFAVNTAVVNLDSYVCSFKHNYYLYEDKGQLSVLPWDLNLSFAGFQSRGSSDAVNFPIDTPVVSGIELSERPLIGALLQIYEYKTTYHDYLQKIVDEYFNSGYFEETVDRLDAMISDYVAKDATAFYKAEQYEAAVQTLKEYGGLRAESIQGQLEGSIPATYDDQEANPDALIDASAINISDRGTQGGDRDKVDRGEDFEGGAMPQNGDFMPPGMGTPPQ